MISILVALLCAGPFAHCKNPPRNKSVADLFARTYTMPPKCFNLDGTVKKRQIKTSYGYRRVRDCVVDHVCALACGGIDSTLNMQWQTYKESKAKDLIEGVQCSKFCTDKNWEGCR